MHEGGAACGEREHRLRSASLPSTECDVESVRSLDARRGVVACSAGGCHDDAGRNSRQWLLRIDSEGESRRGSLAGVLVVQPGDGVVHVVPHRQPVPGDRLGILVGRRHATGSVARMASDVTAETIDLLQQLIRNACVNDGQIESGEEIRSADLLEQYLGTTGLDLERYEPQPGRTSLVARIEGSDPNAPSLLLMGHTDVVPVNPDGWSRDPFSAEIIDDFVWGRGAIDMLNITASQAVAFRRLAESGFKPKGTLTYLAAAEVVRRIQSFDQVPRIQEVYRRFVEGMGYPEEVTSALLDPDGLREALSELPLGMARVVHACTHTTFAPTVMHGGTKTNVIPDSVELQVDVRTLPGQTGEETIELLREALGDMADEVEIESNDDPSTESPIDTPLWDTLSRVTSRLVEGSALVPFLMVGGTDNRFFRRAGSVGYGVALFSRRGA